MTDTNRDSLSSPEGLAKTHLLVTSEPFKSLTTAYGIIAFMSSEDGLHTSEPVTEHQALDISSLEGFEAILIDTVVLEGEGEDNEEDAGEDDETDEETGEDEGAGDKPKPTRRSRAVKGK